MSDLSVDMAHFLGSKGYPVNPIIKQILDALVVAEKLPKKHTGKVNIEINMNDGGVSESTLSVTEKLK
jgi:hypothetical protein